MGPVEYTVSRINGDYAVLISQDGIENSVAMALLPFGVREGDRLLWENFSYTLLE